MLERRRRLPHFGIRRCSQAKLTPLKSNKLLGLCERGSYPKISRVNSVSIFGHRDHLASRVRQKTMSAMRDVAVGRLCVGGCIVPIMRILVADRNALLLKAVSSTFEHQFNIKTGTSFQCCKALLLRAQFDLAIVSEQLADGPGLRLLAHIAQRFPATLRVFAATQSRLQLLEDELGGFGIFRTIPYPIRHAPLLSVLIFARAGFETDVPARLSTESVVARKPSESLRTHDSETTHAQNAGSREPAQRRTVASQSRLSAEAMFPSNMPGKIASTRLPASCSFRLTPLQQPLVGYGSAVPPIANGMHVGAPGDRTPRHRQRTSLARSAALELQSGERGSRDAASHVRKVRVTTQLIEEGRTQQSAPSRLASVHRATTPPSAREGQSPRYTVITWQAPSRDLHSPVSGSAARAFARCKTKRSRVSLQAGILLALLVATLPLELFDAQVRVARASDRRPKIERRDISTPYQNWKPVGLTPLVSHAPSVAQGVAPEADAVISDEGVKNPPIAARIIAVADPSTFGSEAYEPIYTD